MITSVVTGSASGIGAAVRARLEHDGNKVVGIDVRDAEIIADLSTRDGREGAIAGVKQRCGAIDRFVACAGVATDARPPCIIASINYFGAIELLDGLFEELQRGSTPCAVVVLSNSMQWLRIDETPYVQALLRDDEAEAARILDGMPDAFLAASLAYVGSKLALARALRRRAAAWGRAGVRLNGIAPGNTNTPLLKRVLADPNTSGGVANMEIPLGRLAEPAEIAGLVAFLCGPESSYIHGSTIYIDGGIDAAVRPDGL